MSAAPMFDVAERMILTPSGLDEGRLSTVLGNALSCDWNANMGECGTKTTEMMHCRRFPVKD